MTVDEAVMVAGLALFCHSRKNRRFCEDTTNEKSKFHPTKGVAQSVFKCR